MNANKVNKKPWLIWRYEGGGTRVVSSRFKNEKAAQAELRKLKRLALGTRYAFELEYMP